MTEPLGRLKRVDLRDVWTSEAQHFTPWLANDANIQILAELLRLDLVVEATEQNVGPFRADILCKDTIDGSWVLIENQLERTDHNHLGQLLTYAAGLQAVTIVWISSTFTEEHRAALDWLNEITDESYRFFGLEVELWRIGDSLAAPKFNVVSKPNDWSRSVATAKRKTGGGDLSDTVALRLEYWSAFREYAEQAGCRIKLHKPDPRYISTSIGKIWCHLACVSATRGRYVRVELCITGSDRLKYFDLLFNERKGIENDAGFCLEWRRLELRKASLVCIVHENCDPMDDDDWGRQHAWLLEKLEAMHRVFAPLVNNISLEDWTEDLVEEPLT